MTWPGSGERKIPAIAQRHHFVIFAAFQGAATTGHRRRAVAIALELSIPSRLETRMAHYDAIVIGAGQPGPGVAGALVEDGKRVALIEMDRAGGTCLNHGCKPTKALRASCLGRPSGPSGSVVRRQHWRGHGGLRRRHVAVRSIIDGMRDSLDDWLAGVDGLDLLHGTATVVTDPAGQQHQVAVDDQHLTAQQLYLNLGGRATRPPIPGLETVEAMTEVELLALNALPEHLVIVGGGYIGLEFGQMFRRFGAHVTIIAGSRLAEREDEDVSAMLAEMLTHEGVDIVYGRPARVGPGASGIDVELGHDTTITGSHLLVATGRRSNSDLLGPDHGIETDERGFFTIDGRFHTSVKGVWALGDVNGHGAFTHTAYQDGQILLHPPRTVDGRVTIYAVYTDPPLGRVGMTVNQARASGRNVAQGGRADEQCQSRHSGKRNHRADADPG